MSTSFESRAVKAPRRVAAAQADEMEVADELMGPSSAGVGNPAGGMPLTWRGSGSALTTYVSRYQACYTIMACYMKRGHVAAGDFLRAM